MYDRGLSVLEQYEIVAKNTYRGRGSLICNTQAGLLLIKEFQGSAKKLEGQEELLAYIEEKGETKVDTLYKNKEGILVSTDKDHIPYFVKKCYEGRECDTKSKEDISKSIIALADLHKVMHLPVKENYVKESLLEECKRHNAQLRKIQRFIRKKNPKNNFELKYLESVSWFLQQGETVVLELENSGYETLRVQAIERGDICHGEYNQHNVLFSEQKVAVTNFDRWNYDIQIADLYQFMRKILEKHDWDIQMGKQMIETYHKEKAISSLEMENLALRFSYPEKYWKLANHYYNQRKSWVSDKSLEKLELLMAQREVWMKFVGEICRIAKIK